MPQYFIKGIHTKHLSFALLQNAFTVLHVIEIWNKGDTILENAKLCFLSSPTFFISQEYALPSINPGEKCLFENIDLEYDCNLFSSLTTPEKGTIYARLIVDAQQIAETAFTVKLLPKNQWGGLNEFPESIAAFAQPGDTAVDHLWVKVFVSLPSGWKNRISWARGFVASSLKVIKRSMRGHDSAAAWGGYGRGKKDVLGQLDALWGILQAQSLRYVPLSSNFEPQKVLSPTQVLDAKSGTCLDISLLIASCLEQCSLDPLLIFTRGHVFVGCWLSPGSFSTTVIDDVGTLQKRLDLREIVVFDSSLLTRHEQNFSFQQACEQGQESLKGSAASEFICLVDIVRARMQRVRPLALAEGFQRQLQQSFRSVPIHFIGNARKSLDQAFGPAGTAEKTDFLKNRVDRWQRKLLDLSLRNSLLNYRIGKNRRFVEILSSNPGELEDRLADGNRFRLVGGLDLVKDGPHAEKLPAVLAEELLGCLTVEQKGALVTPLEQKELDVRLTNLYRSARATLEEGGSNTLYLAYGFLSWIPEERDKPCKAPLILIPARLERRSVQSGFTLSLGDDEPRFNMSLLELLRKDYNIFDLDAFGMDLPTDDHGLDIDGIWRTVQNAVNGMPGWEVSRTIGLGLFSFAKYLMWKDLVDHTEILMENPVVSHLLSTTGSFPDELAFIEPQELDAKLHPQDMYCPLLADSSQMSAVASAAKGKNFVLIGPPGTGKSQTITNIIAQSLAEKKTVLFVAEKAAALNVVYRRLKQVGLGDFCLELHSNKADKPEVLKQLSRAIASAREAVDGWQRIASRQVRIRERLNDYVRHLHRTYPNGLSAYLAMGTITKGRPCPDISMSWPGPEHHDQAACEALFDVAQKIKNQGVEGKALAGTELRHIQHEEWSPLWEQGLLQSIETLRKAGERVVLCAQGASAASSLPFEDAKGESFEILLQLAEHLLSAHGHAWLFALRPDAANITRQLKGAGALLDAYAEKWFALSAAYRPEAVDADIGELQLTWELASTSWWGKGFFCRSKVRRSLQRLCALAAKPDCGSDLVLLQQLRGLKKQITALEPLAGATSGIFAFFATDREELDAAVTFAEGIHRCLGRLAATPEQAVALNTVLERLLGSGNMLLAKQGSVGRELSNWAEAMRHYLNVADVAKGFMGGDVELSRLPVLETLRICSGIAEQKQHINTWCSWFRVCAQADGLGLQPLVAAVVQGVIEPADTEDALRVNYARWWITQIIEGSDVLRTFVPSGHERIIADFQKLDKTILEMTPACIYSRLRGSALTEGAPAEWRLLQREVAKKKKHMPVRKLVDNLPTMLLKLTPCLLMSPLSIAQYLGAGKISFDLVIFDEASQIPVWDAIGAMARAKKVIVVGDPKQLPPTNFFQKTDDAETDDDDSMDDDLESILEECIAVGLPSFPLRWHYRSRRESLIAFSNRRYYDGGLVTFPSPNTEDMGVKFCFANGVYERGGSRTNPIEARVLVAEILSRLRSPEFQASGQSIGVVTFNSQQQSLIEDLLDAERRVDPALERFFDSELEEPVLVKNLENIQGDERDIIFFSIGFGPDHAGHVTMNFGALNKDGGERRLNVAITRARYELKVFCSLYPDQILLTQTKAQGVHDLRLFLEYAQQGVKAATTKTSGESHESPFGQAVAEALQKRGWQTCPQVGVSAFRIDLGVIDPDNPETYLAGVECDGYTYHRCATARDRDYLREKVLCGLGWDILRAWSTEWWINPEPAADKLHTQLAAILEKKRSTRVDAGRQGDLLHTLPLHQAPSAKKPKTTQPTVPSKKSPDTAAGLTEQERFLHRVIQAVVLMNSPVHEKVLCDLVAKQLGFSRAGSKMRANVLSIAGKAYEQSTEDVGTFFWDKGQLPETYVTFRERDKGVPCIVDEISMPELVALARIVRAEYDDKAKLRRKKPDPATLMAEKLGINHPLTVTRYRPRLEKAWVLSAAS